MTTRLLLSTSPCTSKCQRHAEVNRWHRTGATLKGRQAHSCSDEFARVPHGGRCRSPQASQVLGSAPCLCAAVPRSCGRVHFSEPHTHSQGCAHACCLSLMLTGWHASAVPMPLRRRAPLQAAHCLFRVAHAYSGMHLLLLCSLQGMRAPVWRTLACVYLMSKRHSVRAALYALGKQQ